MINWVYLGNISLSLKRSYRDVITPPTFSRNNTSTILYDISFKLFREKKDSLILVILFYLGIMDSRRWRKTVDPLGRTDTRAVATNESATTSDVCGSVAETSTTFHTTGGGACATTGKSITLHTLKCILLPIVYIPVQLNFIR